MKIEQKNEKSDADRNSRDRASVISCDGIENDFSRESNNVNANRGGASVISRDESQKQGNYEISSRSEDNHANQEAQEQHGQYTNIAIDPQYYEYPENQSWKCEKIRNAVEQNPEIARGIRIIPDKEDQEWEVQVFESEAGP